MDDCNDIIAIVATLLIRRLDDSVKAQLRLRAASHGRSMEEEAREILKTSLTTKGVTPMNLAQSIRRHVEPFGGVDLHIPPREPFRKPPKL